VQQPHALAQLEGRVHVALLRQTSAAIAAAPRAAVPAATEGGARAAAVVPTAAAAAAGAAKRAVQVGCEARAAPPRSAALCRRR